MGHLREGIRTNIREGVTRQRHHLERIRRSPLVSAESCWVGWGVHKFILGYTVEGIIMLAVTLGVGLFTCGISSIAMGVIGLVEGIIYLTKSDEDFSRTYIQNKRGWF
jgi:TM2 domain-containing membrane protein YozV